MFTLCLLIDLFSLVYTLIGGYYRGRRRGGR